MIVLLSRGTPPAFAPNVPGIVTSLTLLMPLPPRTVVTLLVLRAIVLHVRSNIYIYIYIYIYICVLTHARTNERAHAHTTHQYRHASNTIALARCHFQVLHTYKRVVVIVCSCFFRGETGQKNIEAIRCHTFGVAYSDGIDEITSNSTYFWQPVSIYIYIYI